MVDVRYIIKDEGMRYDIYSPAKNIKSHILMPKGKKCSKLLVNSQEMDFELNMVGESTYIDFDLTDINTKPVSIEIIFG